MEEKQIITKKDKKREYNKKYNLLNKEKEKIRSKEYYLKNKEKIKKRIIEYRVKNREQLNKHKRESYVKNKKKQINEPLEDVHICVMNAHNFCNICASKTYISFMLQLISLNIPVLVSPEQHFKMMIDISK